MNEVVLNKTILIIENEVVLGGFLEKKLEKAGYKVSVVRDGERAIADIKENKPDLILLDMSIPGKSGFEILEELKDNNILPDLPVLIIFEFDNAEDVEHAKNLGVREYFIKLNFNPDKVLSMADSILNSKKKQEIIKEDNKISNISSNAKKNILLVEDDPLLSRLLERKLEIKNFKVFKTTEAEHAKTILEENPITLIALDIIIPGLDGFGFLKELKSNERWKDIPVIIVSNLSQKEEIKKGIDLGAIDYLIKSNTTPSEIVNKIESLTR